MSLPATASSAENATAPANSKLRRFIRPCLHRTLQALLVAVTVGTITFVIANMLPGDAAFRIAAGRYGYDIVDGAAADAVRRELGLDRSAFAIYLDWLWSLLRFDLGPSLVSGEPVIHEIAHQLGYSIVLALAAIALSLVIGAPLGVIAGIRPGGLIDRALLVAASGLRALPQFVVGLLLIMTLSVWLGLAPAGGHGEPQHVILPALAIALGLAAVSSRVARDATAAVIASPYYVFARAKGLNERQAFLRHGLRNIGVPVVSYLGVQLVYLVEGVIVVETLFGWPGIGHALVHAIFARDVPMIQGTALVLGLMFVALNALIDIACAIIDPRERT